MATYTLSQVGKTLDLSEGTVKRLSHMLNVPARPTGTVVLRYSERDVETLRMAQSLLVSGKSFAQIQSVMQLAAGNPTTQTKSKAVPTLESSAQELMTIDASPLLKAQMAEETMEAYRASRQKKPTAPLKALAKAMAYPIEKETEKSAHFEVKPAFAPVVSTQKSPKPPSWMSHALREQAVALKRQLVTTP